MDNNPPWPSKFCVPKQTHEWKKYENMDAVKQQKAETNNRRKGYIIDINYTSEIK